jgi:predicted DNA-binding transcriptional regulator AlpA
MHYAQAMREGEELMTEAELARFLSVSLSTVKRLRATGEGPPSIRIAKRAIRYRRADVEDWLRKRAD